MTDTPRTDAVWADKGRNILEHAREMERELSAETALLHAADMDRHELQRQLADITAELTRLRAICNAMPPAAADGPGISIEEAMDHV